MLVSAVVAALVASGLPGRISDAAGHAVCVATGSGCTGSSGATPAGAPPGGAGTDGAASPDGGGPADTGSGPAADGAGSPCGWTAVGDCQQVRLVDSDAPATDPLDRTFVLAASTDGGSVISRLPTGGDYPFVPQKGQNLSNPRSIAREDGWPVDADGNRWEWDNVKGEFDVQHPDGSHTNIGPDGEVTHGETNFPKRPKPPKKGKNKNTDDAHGGVDPAKAVVVGGAAVGGGAALWWLGKLASPACGPAVVVCAIAF